MDGSGSSLFSERGRKEEREEEKDWVFYENINNLPQKKILH